jgi:hypothetical protein
MTAKWLSMLVAGFVLGLLGPLSHQGVARDEQPKPFQHTTLLLVKKIYESDDAIAELSALPGVERVMRNLYTKTLMINYTIPQSKARPSPTEIWEIAERLELEPYRLVTAEGTYTSKPVPEAIAKSKSKSKSKTKTKTNPFTIDFSNTRTPSTPSLKARTANSSKGKGTPTLKSDSKSTSKANPKSNAKIPAPLR